MASQFGRFKPNRSGIAALFKGAAMQSALADAGAKVESSANASVDASALPTKWRKITERYDSGNAPYTASVKVLSGTAVGVVRTSSLLGMVDENQNHTLEGSL